MFDSASGVLKQRADPNRLCRPLVTPKTPPFPSTCSRTPSSASATSSPKTRIRSSRFEQLVQRGADRIGHREDVAGLLRVRPPVAVRVVSRPVVEVLRGGDDGIVEATGRSRSPWPGRAVLRREPPRRPVRPPRVGLCRIAAAPSASRIPALIRSLSNTSIGSWTASSASSSASPVLRLRVSRRVRVGPGHLRMDEPGSFPGSHPGDRPARPCCLHDGVVPSVDLGDRKTPEAPDQLVHRCRGLVGGAHRDRKAVVRNQVEHRQVELAGRVQALPELAFSRWFPPRATRR